jgi:hypothetical protein
MLGVLLHAAALIRHHGVMLNAHLDYQVLVAGLTAICHGDPDVASSPADLPGPPSPPNAQKDCPVCSGQAPTLAVAPLRSLEEPIRLAASSDWSEFAETPRALPHPVCPPARGPPRFA